MSEQGGGIPTLDQANMKKIVDLITFPAGQLFRDQLSLDDSLNKLDNFFIRPTHADEIVPIQFAKASEVDFKLFTRAIARNLGSFRKIALYELQEMTRLKVSPYATPQQTEGFKMQEQTQDIKFSEEMKKEGFMDKITKPFHKEEPTFNLVRNSISELTKFQSKYENWLHWYWLACEKRSKINTRKAKESGININSKLLRLAKIV